MQIHVTVASPSPEIEAEFIKKIAAQLLRHGVQDVVMIVDNERTEYKDGGTTVSTPSVAELFARNPLSSPFAVVLAKEKS